MSKRVCAEPGCAALVDKGRCTTHRRERDKARGTSSERGYDYAHQQDRAAWAPLVATGRVQCRRAPHLLDPDDPWDLGHPDADCPKPKAPECIPCNRATAGRTGTPPGA